jgi:hypothetical protein
MLAFAFLAGFVLPAAAATDARLSESYGKLPLQFEANRGQTHKDVRFLSRGPGYGLYLTADEAVLVLSKPAADAKRVALRMSLVGAARKPLASGIDELPGKANYFIGRDPSKWRRDVPTYGKVHYQNVYPGIDLVYYGNQRQLEYDFVLAPGADPNKIVLGFKGADKLEIDAEGSLVLHASGGDIRQHKPVIYQDIDGVRRDIAGGYVRKDAKRVGFQVAAYDASRPLIIDPVVLSYSTYLGGNGGDFGAAIAVDAGGNAYVTGNTSSTDFPTTAGAFQVPFGGNIDGDAFVTKLNSTGTALVYSTYLGGIDYDSGSGIAVDTEGNAYVTGYTRSNNFPISAGAFQTTFADPAGSGNVFVTKIDPTGAALVYSTYLGGSGDEQFSGARNGIALDSSGSAYVTGSTRSADFPITAGAFQSVHSGAFDNPFVTKLDPTGSTLIYSTFLGEGTGQGIAVDSNGSAYVIGNVQGPFPTTSGAVQRTGGRVFVTKLDPAGTTLVYSTLLGGGREGGEAIAVDAEGNAYVTGYTYSASFPTTPGAFQPTFGDALDPPNRFGPDPDAFVTKLNPTGSALVYSTYLGGNGAEFGRGIAVDASGNAYVTGSTGSLNFPTTPGAFQPTLGGGPYDAFVTKLHSAGAVLVYSTYLGGGFNHDIGQAIAVDATGHAYVTGRTESGDFPTTAGAFQQTHAGGRTDTFVTKVNPAGSALVYSTFLGGNGDDRASGIAIDGDNSAYVTGTTDSNNFPTTVGAFKPVGGSRKVDLDAFVAKIFNDVPPPAPVVTRSEESAATEIGFWSTYGAETGTFSGGSIVASNVAASSAMFSFTGTAVSWIGVKCNVCGIAVVSIDGGAPIAVNTAGPNAPGSLTSESVFSASGLAAASHTMVITVTGTSSSGGAYVAVDAFDVTGGSASSPLLPPVVLPPPPVVVPPLPPVVGL